MTVPSDPRELDEYGAIRPRRGLARRWGPLVRRHTVQESLAGCLGLLLGGLAVLGALLALGVLGSRPLLPGLVGAVQGSQPVASAILGGPSTAFTTAYGTPTPSAGQATYRVRLPDGTAVGVCVCAAATGIDGQPRAALLRLTPVAGATWSAATAGRVASQFEPADARATGVVHGAGTQHVYRSAQLAATLPADAFVDAATGIQIAPGTFSVTCDNPAAVGCTLTLGR